MYFRIMTLLSFLVYSTVASSEELCFEHQDGAYAIKKINHQKYSLLHKESGESITYFCSIEKDQIDCSAEDDSGYFVLKNKAVKLGPRQYFGSPDHLIHSLDDTGTEWISLKDCQ